MSDSQTVWMILWQHAFQGDTPRPFEIADVVPEVARSLQVDQQDARRLVTGLLTELSRMPEGKQYFRQEGNAVAPLPELTHVARDPKHEFQAYPYEL